MATRNSVATISFYMCSFPSNQRSGINLGPFKTESPEPGASNFGQLD